MGLTFPKMTSGSNSSGSWVKFPDGTMECYTTIPITSFSSTNNYFNYDNQSFPMAFISAPTCSIDVYSSSTGFAYGSTASCDILALSGSLYRYGVAFNGSQAAAGTWYVQIRAIGRWK